jgi:hypothetical protein
MLYDVVCAACIKCVIVLQCTHLQAGVRHGRAISSFSSTRSDRTIVQLNQTTLLHCCPLNDSN